MTIPLQTKRLTLIPSTREVLAADLNDRGRFSRLLQARVPPAWPPPLMDEGVIREFLRMHDDPSGPLFAAWYWVINDPTTGAGTLIGNGGILQAGGGRILQFSGTQCWRSSGTGAMQLRL